MSNSILKDIIINKVYSEKIQEISAAADKNTKWIMDFKGQSVDKVFLENYAKEFFSSIEILGFKEIQIGGMESGAIPLVAALSLMDTKGIIQNSFYIRKSRKKSDMANLLEGQVLKDIPIILVDDILNTSSTFKKQIVILKELGFDVSTIFVALRFRDLDYYTDLKELGINIISILDLNDFTQELGVTNLKENLVLAVNYKKYILDYKVILSKPNLYMVNPKSGPCLDGQYIYMGSDDGNFFCIDKNTGASVWTYRVLFGTGGKRIFSSPIIHKDAVMFGAYDGNFYCLDKLTGKKKWVFIEADWIGSSPCVDNEKGVVYIGLEFAGVKNLGGLAAIDVNIGKIIWRWYESDKYVHASPAFNAKHNMVVCGSNDNNIYAFDALTGKLKWKFLTNGQVKYSSVFDDSRNLVIFGSMDGGVYALSIKDGSLYHKFEALFGFYSTPAIEGDKIIIGSLDKNIYCFDINKKVELWKYTTSGRIFASPNIDGDSVFIGSNDARLYELDINNGKLISSIQLSERIVNRVQIERDANGKRVIYIPTHACELYKFIEN